MQPGLYQFRVTAESVDAPQGTALGRADVYVLLTSGVKVDLFNEDGLAVNSMDEMIATVTARFGV